MTTIDKIGAPTLNAVNSGTKAEFMTLLGDVVEHSPWVAERAFPKRPFSSVEDINAKLMACISESSESEKLELFNRHPELAGQEAIAGAMTESSTGEQARLGLTRLAPDQFARLSHINSEYRAKFKFPFIAALRLHDDLESVMLEGEASLLNSHEHEINRTLQQIKAIVYGRLCKIFASE